MATQDEFEHRLGNHSVPGVERVPWCDHDGRARLMRRLVAAGGLDQFFEVMDPRPELNTTRPSDPAEEPA